MVYSKFIDGYILYDDGARTVSTFITKDNVLNIIMQRVVGSTTGKTLRLNLEGTQIFVNFNRKKLVFGDITKEATFTNMAYVDRGVGGPIADF